MSLHPFRFSTAAWLFVATLLSAGAAQAQDSLVEMREAAKNWAMHRIAVVQAASGDFQGAKRTASQIGEDGDPGFSDVTVVWTCNGRLLYDHVPGTPNHGVGWQGFFNSKRPVDPAPSAAPAGLPSDYLAADPRHGKLVGFSDECDARGTRVTLRTYADGHVVIETPQAVRAAE